RGTRRTPLPRGNECADTGNDALALPRSAADLYSSRRAALDDAAGDQPADGRCHPRHHGRVGLAGAAWNGTAESALAGTQRVAGGRLHPDRPRRTFIRDPRNEMELRTTAWRDRTHITIMPTECRRDGCGSPCC